MITKSRSLTRIFEQIGHFGKDIGCNDKGSTHSYIIPYDNLLKPYKDKSKILEIGVAKGDSLKLWDKYFTNSFIVGVDIEINVTPWVSENYIDLIECDATAPIIRNKISCYGKFDVVVDDGSHVLDDQVKAFGLVKPFMAPGGIYIIEDVANIDESADVFKWLHSPCEIQDLRAVKGRYDDVLVIFKF